MIFQIYIYIAADVCLIQKFNEMYVASPIIYDLLIHRRTLAAYVCIFL